MSDPRFKGTKLDPTFRTAIEDYVEAEWEGMVIESTREFVDGLEAYLEKEGFDTDCIIQWYKMKPMQSGG